MKRSLTKFVGADGVRPEVSIAKRAHAVRPYEENLWIQKFLFMN